MVYTNIIKENILQSDTQSPRNLQMLVILWTHPYLNCSRFCRAKFCHFNFFFFLIMTDEMNLGLSNENRNHATTNNDDYFMR